MSFTDRIQFLQRNLMAVGLILGTVLANGQVIAEEDGQATRGVIVCSTTQVADFCRQVAGDRWDVKCVLAPGADPHMFTVTPDAIQLVRSADLCFDNGMHLEGGDWMRTLATTEGKPIVSCTEGIQPLMIAETVEENDSADGGEDDAPDEHVAPDPHAWFAVKNAAQYVRNIHKTLQAADPDGASEYEARATLYLGQLRALRAWMMKAVSAVPMQRRVLVTSHDAFNYFCQEMKFKARSPVGWSTQEVGAELTPARRALVIKSIVDAGVPAIFVETSVNPEAIQQIAAEAGVAIGGKLYSDSMGAAGTLGDTYIGMMRENVITIVTALTKQDGESNATNPNSASTSDQDAEPAVSP